MSHFDAAGIAVYALSYDEPDALQDFAQAHGISYTLLSDPESKVIRSFGILNTLIDPDDHPWYGIPYPGSYVVDSAGLITHKFFDSNLAVRAGPEQLLAAALGEVVEDSAVDAVQADSVSVSVRLDGDALTPVVQKDLVVRFSVPSGRHVYAEPAPEGSVAVSVELDNDQRLVQRPVIRPDSESHTLAGTKESFEVHHGVFELRIPLTLNSLFSSDAGEITVSGEIRWQSCDDEVCDIPARQRFECRLPVSEAPPVALGGNRGSEIEPNAMAHFQKMTQRHGGTG
jgi:hypothetical protein